MPEIVIHGKRPCVNRSMRVLFQLVTALGTILATVPASAQVYKWVDEKGVTNYSNEAPTHRKTVKRVAIVTDRISFYTPDKSLTGTASVNPALADRVDRLERQLQAERQARQYAAATEAEASMMAAYQQCVADRRVDCDGYGGYLPYGPLIVVVPPFRHRPRVLLSTVPLSGVTAGNVTAAIRAAGGSFNGTLGVSATFRPVSGTSARGFFTKG